MFDIHAGKFDNYEMVNLPLFYFISVCYDQEDNDDHGRATKLSRTFQRNLFFSDQKQARAELSQAQIN